MVYQQLQLLTHAATTTTFMQQIALSLTLVKPDAIRTISTLDGIVFMVFLGTQRCPLNVQA